MTKKKHSTKALSGKDSVDAIEPVNELSEDMELISPGSILREAREKLSLSQEDIAKKLNFKVSLVVSIEKDIFDPALPATFNRGYLTNFAKLVLVDVEDVLASYDVLDAANIQRSEMQSFSKQTVKEAEHSRVMWLSYLILIALIGLTALWWQQDNKQVSGSAKDTSIDAGIAVANLQDKSQTVESNLSDNESELSELDGSIDRASSTNVENSDAVNADVNNSELGDSEIDPSIINDQETDNTEFDDFATNVSDDEEPELAQIQNQTLSQQIVDAEASILATAIFTFSGDCWVNIYDATNERIAWGVKKSGYVMQVEGVAPLRITLGKPELATIVFNEQAVDMSEFNHGNIAKFTLPLTP